jgi:hypothetical protein
MMSAGTPPLPRWGEFRTANIQLTYARHLLNQTAAIDGPGKSGLCTRLKTLTSIRGGWLFIGISSKISTRAFRFSSPLIAREDTSCLSCITDASSSRPLIRLTVTTALVILERYRAVRSPDVISICGIFPTHRFANRGLASQHSRAAASRGLFRGWSDSRDGRIGISTRVPRSSARRSRRDSLRSSE